MDVLTLTQNIIFASLILLETDEFKMKKSSLFLSPCGKTASFIVNLLRLIEQFYILLRIKIDSLPNNELFLA